MGDEHGEEYFAFYFTFDGEYGDVCGWFVYDGCACAVEFDSNFFGEIEEWEGESGVDVQTEVDGWYK